MPDLPLPGEAERALYAEVLAQGGQVLFRDVRPEDAAAVLYLLESGLLVHHTGDATLTAVNPRTVAERLGAGLRRSGAEALRRADEVPELLTELTRAYDAALRKVDHTSTVLHVQEMQEIRSRIVQLEADCQDEFLAAQPGGARSAGLLASGAERSRRFLEGGGSLRSLYQPEARLDPVTAEYAATVADWGGQTRILGEPYSRLVIVDRRTAIVPAAADDSSAAFIEDPAVVGFLVNRFERDWERAERVQWRSAQQFPTHEQVGRMLTQGLTQKKIASRLGLSERTVAGHISRLRELHDAETLFQLGWQMRGARAAG
ncbi:LuxR C-terminal-related transcriptional regulator [Kitasatospora sp. P5_F3]